MSTLQQLQWRFVAAVVYRQADAMADLLMGDPTGAAARMRVYINNHDLGMREALTAVYPVVRRLLGPECFDLLARTYVDTYPKPSGNLLDFGEFLADLIEDTDALTQLPYLADVARLEWLRHEVARAADCDLGLQMSRASLAKLDALALAELRLRCVPAARLFHSQFPVLRIWQANQQDDPTPVSLDEGAVNCLLLRSGSDIRVERVSDAEYAFLTAIHQQTVCAAIDAVLAVHPHFDLPACLARWLNCLQHESLRSAP